MKQLGLDGKCNMRSQMDLTELYLAAVIRGLWFALPLLVPLHASAWFHPATASDCGA